MYRLWGETSRVCTLVYPLPQIWVNYVACSYSMNMITLRSSYSSDSINTCKALTPSPSQTFTKNSPYLIDYCMSILEKPCDKEQEQLWMIIQVTVVQRNLSKQNTRNKGFSFMSKKSSVLPIAIVILEVNYSSLSMNRGNHCLMMALLDAGK